MALGQLVVRLGLDAAEFTSGMSKAERDAYKFGESIGTGLKTAALGAAAAVAAIGFAAKETFDFLNSNIQATAKFQDLAEKVGDTAENFASLKKASDVSGVSLDGVAAASVKLTAALSKTDEDGHGAANAIKALGLNFDEFKKQSPAEQMDTVAKALAGFQDGANKTAVAVALFGKAGADLLPFLNDLADGSERQISLTGDQIKAANDFSEAMARLSSNSNTLRQQLVAQLIPTLSDLLKAFTDTGSEMSDMGAKAQPFASAMEFIRQEMKRTVADTLTLASGFSQLFTFIGGYAKVSGQLLKGNFDEAKAIGASVRAEIEATSQKYDILKQKALSAGDAGRGKGFADPRLLNAPAEKPVLPFSGIKDKKEPKAKAEPKDKITEAQRYLEHLEKQLQTAEKLTAEEKLQQDILKGKIDGIEPVIQAQLLGVARQIDAEKARGEATKAAEETARQELEETQKTYEDGIKARQALESEAQALRESVKTDLQIFTDLQAKFNGMVEQGLISQETGVLLINKAKKAYEETLKPLGDYTEMAKTAGESLASGLTDAIIQGKSLADVFKNVVKQLAAMILKAIIFKGLQVLGNAIAPGLGTAIFGKAGGGDINQNSPHLVGEKGPEIFMPKQSGNIIPNNQLGGSGSVVKQQSNVYNISAGGVSREEFMSGLNRTKDNAVSDVRQNRLRRRA
jgi:hypothetical protein